jgi:hypothetical protein
MIYTDLDKLNYKNLTLLKDSKFRVIPSIMYIENDIDINNLTSFIMETSKNSDTFMNDMDLLGMYNNANYFNFQFKSEYDHIFDGAAIGQYLGGVDPRNLPNFEKSSIKEKQMIIYNNPSKEFINETSEFKIKKTFKIIFKKVYTEYSTIPINFPFILDTETHDIKKIMNMHVHSKQLYQFSSIFNLMYTDIITGDRVCELCDFVLTTLDIYNYHKSLKVNVDNIIIITDFFKIK